MRRIWNDQTDLNRLEDLELFLRSTLICLYEKYLTIPILRTIKLLLTIRMDRIVERIFNHHYLMDGEKIQKEEL